MNGLNAAVALRERLGRRTPPLLISVSGHVEHLKLAAAGTIFHHVLPKPVNSDRLVQVLEDARLME